MARDPTWTVPRAQSDRFGPEILEGVSARFDRCFVIRGDDAIGMNANERD
jgi:hypothetical protein